MKTGFKAPLAPKKQKPKDHPEGGKKSPFDFTCPQYDQRSSCFIAAGTDYGVGHTNPVGHEGNPKMKVPTLPFGRVNTLETDRI